jgi:4'-phosphopantetheinyl transferase
LLLNSGEVRRACGSPKIILSIYWLLQTYADLPATNEAASYEFLSPAEQERLASFKLAKRRREWLLGRWTARRLVQQLLATEGRPVALSSIGIANAADGAPELRLPATVAASPAWSLSISHRADYAFCAVDTTGRPIGADIEQIEPRSAAFVGDFFTTAEQALVYGALPADRALLANLIWSAKEAVLKVLRHGLRVDTRRVECLPGFAVDAWQPVSIRCDGQLSTSAINGHWQRRGAYVLTLALG